MKMTLYDVVTLAVVVWYLMLPPQISRNPLTFNASAPLSKWYFAGMHDTANECSKDTPIFNSRWLAAIRRSETHDQDRKVREVSS